MPTMDPLAVLGEGLAPMDLTDWYQPTDTRMVSHMSKRPTEHNGTIRWPPQRNFSKVVLMDRLGPHVHRHPCVGLIHAKTFCMAKL